MEFLNVFASVDRDNDLVIHESDLDAYAADMKYEKAFTRKWLRLFDLDKDGKFTFSDFCETLGLDEKIYQEKLIEARKNVALRQKQPQQSTTVDSDRASRRTSRLPRQTASTTERTVRPAEQEVKENIEPQQVSRARTVPAKKEPVVEEDVIQPQVTRKAQSGLGPKVTPEEVEIEIGSDEDPNAISVEFSDMEAQDLEQARRVLAEVNGQHRRAMRAGDTAGGSSTGGNGEFERSLMHALDKRMGKTWQSQVNPQLSANEVNYQEGTMAILVSPSSQKRVMLWKPQPSGGLCCCS